MDKKWDLSGDSSLESDMCRAETPSEVFLRRSGLREVLGSERFDEIVKSKKDKV